MPKSPAKSDKTSQEPRKKQEETDASKITTPSKSSKEKSDSLTPSESQNLSTDTKIKQTSVQSKSVEKHNALAKISPSKPVGKTTDSTKASTSKTTGTPEKEKSQSKASHSDLPTKTSTSKKPSPNSKTVTPEKPTPTAKSSSTPGVGTKKPSPGGKSATPKTPKAEVKSTPGKAESKVGDVDVIPSSLERKSSGYQSFMMREGPQALGSKEIPRVMANLYLGDVFHVLVALVFFTSYSFY